MNPYMLVAGVHAGLHECHVFCRLSADERLELVTPDGSVVGTWPPDHQRTDDEFIASGVRLFLNRGDLAVRMASREGSIGVPDSSAGRHPK